MRKIQTFTFSSMYRREWHCIAWLCWCAVKNLLTTLPPVALVLQPPQSVTHFRLAFITLPLPSYTCYTLSRLCITHCLQQPLAPPSGSPKCLRFGHWLTLCTLNIHLLTYLVLCISCLFTTYDVAFPTITLDKQSHTKFTFTIYYTGFTAVS